MRKKWTISMFFIKTVLGDWSTFVSDPEAERAIHPCGCAERPSDLAHTSSLQFTIFYQIIFSMIATCWRLWLRGLEGDIEEDVDEDVVTDTIGYLEPEGLVIQYNSPIPGVCFPQTWYLSKILHSQIFRLKVLHRKCE